MNPIERLRGLWQSQPGEHLTSLAAESPAWLISLVLHLVLIVVLASANVAAYQQADALVLSTSPVVEPDELEIPEEFVMSDIPSEQLGANSLGGAAIAEAMALNVSAINNVPPPEFFPDIGDMFSDPVRDLPTANTLSQEITVRGSTGVGATGTMGAIDQITQEILQSLEQREVLLVWLFDRSISMEMQRDEVVKRIDRIYEELGILEGKGNEAFTRHAEKPLISSVIAFGQKSDLLTDKPTDSVEELRQAIASVKADDSGFENIFSAINVALDRYKYFRLREPRRNVMMIAFTDEVGTDQHLLDQTVNKCRNLEVPVYVVGVPAPFGRRVTEIKYVNPDPKYDRVVQWAPIDQGPESLYPEFVQLYSPNGGPEEPIDSGYGPYSLTRLCYETGGTYFAVHPNRNSQRRVTRQETAVMSAQLSRFFKPEVMRKYRPEYLPTREVDRLISDNQAKQSLVAAARMSGVAQMEAPRLRFPKPSDNEAQFVNMLTEAQKAAALLEPRINQIYEILRMGEKDRAKITEARWQAGYDLAMGRVLAAKVRTESYNLMLARAKQGMKFKDPKNDTWDLRPSNTVSVGSALERQAADAKKYLERVVAEHPGTPWAYLAEQELKQEFAWEWREAYQGINERRVAMAGNNNNAPPRRPQDDQARMLPKKPAPPPPPKL